MMNKIIGVIAVLAFILSIVGLVGGNQSDSKSFGGTTNYDAIQLDNGDLTITKGNISVANTSTSTISVGNVTTYATSSATLICMHPVATTTNIVSGTSGVVLWNYGACPF